jgi:flagellar hook-associated protein 2
MLILEVEPSFFCLMAGIQLSGLASGMDWRSLIDQLMRAEAAPQDKLRAEKAAGQQKSTALDSLKSQMVALQGALQPLLGGESSFSGRTASVADTSSGWKVSAGSGALTGQYKVQVTQLATTSKLSGSADVGAGLSSTSDVSGLTLGTLPIAKAITAGDFTVNGAKISVSLTDSLQDVFDKISSQTGGAVAASYDPASDKVRLTSTASPQQEIVLGSANDSSNFLSALQLFNNGSGDILPPKALGVMSVSKALVNSNLRFAAGSVDAAGNGSFKINGTEISYNVNTDSMQSVLARVNSSAAGVTASYDVSSDRFTLTNKSTGDVGISVSESPGGLLQSMGLASGPTLSRGKNALFKVNDGDVLTSASNTLDSAALGINGLSLTVSSETTQTITVAGDNSVIRSKIDDFITKYNAVQNSIDFQTRVTKGADGKIKTSTLSGNSEMGEIARQLRSKVFSAVPGLSDGLQRLESIGIDFQTGSNSLQVKDSAKLEAALRDNPDKVTALIAGKPDGVMARLDSYLTQVTGASGVMAAQTGSIARQSANLDSQIAAMDRRMAQQKAQLEQSFIQMEQAQSNIQRQLSALTNSFK